MSTAAFRNPFLANRARPVERPIVTLAAPRTRLIETLVQTPNEFARIADAAPSGLTLAVTFAALVDDPLSHPDRFANVALQTQERGRLLSIVARLARAGARRDAELLAEARAEIRQAWTRPRPAESDDVSVLAQQAQHFAEQDALGGDDAIAALFDDRLTEYERTGRWRGTLLELRACFWYFWLWAERLGVGAAGRAEDQEAVRALHKQMRAQWDEYAEELERALEPFKAPRLSATLRVVVE
jgi:hypothetical protein